MNNTKTTKRALLSSVMAMLLCITMLIGTTFAWFTDSASTAVNKIQAGTLDVQLLDASGNSLEGQTLKWVRATATADGAEFVDSEDILWEPGCTYQLQPIVIKNAGNLALKYKIVITGIQGDAELNEAIEWTITNTSATTALDADHPLAAGASDTLTIKGHMKESAGNEYQGKSIDGIAITVLATQDTVEHDSYDEQYDKDATYPVYSAESLKNAIDEVNSSEEVNSAILVVTDDFVYNDDTLNIENRKDVTIDLAGNNLKIVNDNQDGLVVTAGATLNLTNSVAGNGKYVFDCTSSNSDSIYVYNDVEGETTTLNIDNPVQIEINASSNSAFHAYGEKGNAVINIKDGTKVMVTGANAQTSAVIVDQNAAFIMEGGLFELNVDFDSFSYSNDVVGVLLWGQNGAQKNNTFKLSGGTFKVGGKNAFAQAIQIGMKNGASDNCTADITGGEIILDPTENGLGYAFTAYNASYGKFTMSGGSVSGTLDALTTTAYGGNADLTVTGGTFSIAPTEYVDTASYDIVNSGSVWTVTAK